MTRRYAASYECGRRLVAAGCPLDYLETLPRVTASRRKRLYARQLQGPAESCILDFGDGGFAYIIALAIGTDLSRGNVIADWTFVPPWDQQHINWDYDASEIGPLRDRCVYKGLSNDRLSAVLNDRRLLTRGCAVEGLLCGFALEPIPESDAGKKIARAQLNFTDDMGCTVTLPIPFTIDHSMAQKTRMPTGSRRLFDQADPPNSWVPPCRKWLLPEIQPRPPEPEPQFHSPLTAISPEEDAKVKEIADRYRRMFAR